MAKDAVAPDSLPGEINAATRALHTSLNRLITSRLPLALPPYASDPALYTTGLLHFSHIFLTFESLWNDLISTAPNATSPGGTTSPPTSPLLSFLLVNPYDAPSLFSSPPSSQLLSFLQALRPRGLARSGRLKRDLEFLTDSHPTDLDVLLASYPGDKVAEYCAHIRRNVQAKPHVLVAYAWCFYMAVFSGGRWIRSELMKHGSDFWAADREGNDTDKKRNLAVQGLSFWNFPGIQDGEDIKAEFKARLAEAETLLTDDERVDIIEEARTIFKLSAGLVQELDEKLGTDAEKTKHVRWHQDVKAGDLSKETNLAPEAVRAKMQPAEPVMWLRRPEVTGAVVALGCLACVALLRLDF